MNRILINANQPEEIRVALVQEIDHKNKLNDLDIEYVGREQKKNNIYKGKISNIEPSLEAAFVDYGATRHGFLPFKEVVPNYTRRGEAQNIRSLLELEQELMVQITQGERGNKGVTLTTYVTLPGSYLILMPNNPGAGGISRRIDGEERRDMRELLNQMEIPEHMGLILRTAGVGRELRELQTDLALLLKQWEAIQRAFHERPAPFLIFQEGDVVLRSIRDYLCQEIDEIVIDEALVFEKAKLYIEQIRPDFLPRLKLYQETMPLFMHFDIEEAAESAFQREVRLASGASIVIDCPEALVAIDVNSGRSTNNENIEETALKTNLEASEEIARQLRIRGLGGSIVIDFIDMASEDNKRQVEGHLLEATKQDRARIRVGRISPRGGLLEMSRQRLRHSLGRANETPCPRCRGQGIMRSIESLALSIIRAIEKEVFRKGAKFIRVEVPTDMANYLYNEKLAAIDRLKNDNQVTISLITNPHWEIPYYQIASSSERIAPSTHYTVGERIHPSIQKVASIREKPAVQGVGLLPTIAKLKTKLSLSKWLRAFFSGLVKSKQVASTAPVSRTPRLKSVYRKNNNSRKDYRNINEHGGRKTLVNQPRKRPSGHTDSPAEKKLGVMKPVTNVDHLAATEPKIPATTPIPPANSSESVSLASADTMSKRPRSVRRFGGGPKFRSRSYTNTADNGKNNGKTE